MNAIIFVAVALAIALAHVVRLASRERAPRTVARCVTTSLRSMSAGERVSFAEGIATVAKANRLATYYTGARKRASDRAEDLRSAYMLGDDAALIELYQPCYTGDSLLPCLCLGCK